MPKSDFAPHYDERQKWHKKINTFIGLTSSAPKMPPWSEAKTPRWAKMLGALKAEGIRVPDGFATTAEAYWEFLKANDLKGKIRSHLQELQSDKSNPAKIGKAIRNLFLNKPFPEKIAEAIRSAHQELCKRHETEMVDVAVRSSATAEDLPEASFAGQQETFLNITGEDEWLDACRKCYASLFTDRAISYREEKGFDHTKIALSVGVQKMVRSDRTGSGVMFSIDTETGFRDAVVIDAAWGLGENVVQGAVNLISLNPDSIIAMKKRVDERVGKYKSYHEKGLLRPPEEPAQLIWWLATLMAVDLHGQVVNTDDAATRRRAAADLGVSTF